MKELLDNLPCCITVTPYCTLEVLNTTLVPISYPFVCNLITWREMPQLYCTVPLALILWTDMWHHILCPTCSHWTGLYVLLGTVFTDWWSTVFMGPNHPWQSSSMTRITTLVTNSKNCVYAIKETISSRTILCIVILWSQSLRAESRRMQQTCPINLWPHSGNKVEAVCQAKTSLPVDQ